LVPYSLTKPLRLTTDASPIGAAAIISHVEGEEEFPIAFASKTFTPTEQRYPQHEREAAAIMFGIKKLHKYLYGRDFEFVTDNQPIVALYSPKDHVRPLAALLLPRWGMLSAYRYKIRYARGTTLPYVDHLSRVPSPDQEEIGSDVFLVKFADSEILTALTVAEETQKDPTLNKVYRWIQSDWPDQCDDPKVEPYHRYKLELTTEAVCVLRGARVIIPPVLQQQVMEMLHDTHPGISRMKSLARSYFWWPNMDAQLEELVTSCGTFC
jgi:hypothetical protein